MLILFDLDGTLIDPIDGVIRSIDYVTNYLKLPNISQEIIKTFIGPPIFNSLKNTLGLSDKDAAIATELFRDIYKQKFLFNANVYDGIPLLLEKIQNNANEIAVATYKRQEHAELILKHFGLNDYFDFIQGSDAEGKRNKTDIIKLCLEYFSVKNALMIGDTLYDAKAAKDLDLDFVSVSWGYGFKRDDAVVHSVAELADFLSSKKII
ncbi:HAD family hydrolase [Campylobacter lari subsp. concheus]|uniref:HAD-IA family hydrolase n=1 Tax=Campylobacter lari TaxID=201 RepID=UPI00179BA0CB|nr:HAD-IA family hydrolase [Campylobacter lari]EAJ5701980.1 HAD family hydrolase [Campylobacter lari]MCR2078013.1 HAD-IA family hydrolase [Campylobacter lari subsp. concheus]MCR2087292.1 HAD-IA family hydrolase [Campylobacter lari subsp. concheus]